MKNIQDSQLDYLQIVFAGRNKNYGGYELRAHYPKRVKAALAYVLSVCLLLIFISKLTYKKDVVVLPTTPKVIEPFLPPLHIEDPILEQPKGQTAPTGVNTEASRLKIVQDIFVPDFVVAPDAEEMSKPKLTPQGIGSASGDDTDALGQADGSSKGNGLGMGKKKDAAIPTFVEQMPEFPGGEAGLIQFLNQNLTYPPLAREAGMEGKVFISFVVNEDGSISDIKALRGFGYGSEEESIRVVKAMPKWKAGKQNGQTVRVYFNLPITFKLN